MTHLKIKRFCTKPISSFSQSKRGQLQSACAAAAPSAGQGLSVHHTHTLRDGLHPRRSGGLSAPRAFGSEAPWHVSWELHQPPCRSRPGLTPTAPLPGRPSICVCMAPPHPPGSLPVPPLRRRCGATSVFRPDPPTFAFTGRVSIRTQDLEHCIFPE